VREREGIQQVKQAFSSGFIRGKKGKEEDPSGVQEKFGYISLDSKRAFSP